MAKRGRQKRQPGFDGKMELVAGEVDAVYERGKKESVVINIRESTISTMHARKQIDDAQYMAAQWCRRQFERMRIGSGAIDPSYEPVDQSGFADPIPDRVIDAGRTIAQARLKTDVGGWAWAILEMVCVEGCTVQEASDRRFGHSSRSQLTYTGRVFRDALDALAAYLGYTTPMARPQNVVDKRSA